MAKKQLNRKKCAVYSNGAVSSDKSSVSDVGMKKETLVPALECYQDVAPRRLEWLVFLVTVCWRVYYVYRKENWWILHPDEIFQSIGGTCIIMSFVN